MLARLKIERSTVEFPICNLDLNVESISRTHLQELLDIFPSIEAGGDRTQEADTSDEEYQIYEQHSDGNFSNKDDC